jgi:shikimate kinase
MKNTIILIGPMCSGKSTLGEAISKKTGVPRCSMDDVRFDYYKEIGFSEERQREIHNRDGFEAVYKYWKPFEAHAVKRVLEDYPDHIHDFGGGHSVYEDENLLNVVKTVLDNYKNVFLILPCQNEVESLKILNKRLEKTTDNDAVLRLNEHFIKHISNKLLAKHIIYTEGKSIEDAAEEIIQLS